MTPRQVENIKLKIDRLRQELVADKRKHGGFFDDSRGIRYSIPELYLRIEDYKGAIRYFSWFSNNFPDDSGYPIFLFEWTITLFMKGNVQEAEKKAFQTYFSNTYLIDDFLGMEYQVTDIGHSNWKRPELLEDLRYSQDEPKLKAFAMWLRELRVTEKFQQFINEYLDIHQKLKTESVGSQRSELVKRLYSLQDHY